MKRFVKDVPPAENETDPESRFPFALFGVLNPQEATPLTAFPVPFPLNAPTEAVQRTRVGLTAEPPFVTRTAATSIEPAFGFAGESLIVLAVALAVPPPP